MFNIILSSITYLILALITSIWAMFILAFVINIWKFIMELDYHETLELDYYAR